MMKKITMMITEDECVIDISSNVDVVVSSDEDIHVADLIYNAVLDECLSQSAGILDPGTQYNVKLLAVVTSITDEDGPGASSASGDDYY